MGNSAGKFYNILPIQSGIYNKVHPHPEDSTTTLTTCAFQHKIHVLFSIKGNKLDLLRLKNIADSVSNESQVLSSKLSRNDKIIDADVEGFIKSSECLVDKIECVNDDYQTIQASLNQWILSNNEINPTFRIGYIQDKLIDNRKVCLLLFCSSGAYLDTNSLIVISHNILNRYLQVGFRIDLKEYAEKNPITEIATLSKLDSISKIKALAFYKEQCFEHVERNVSDELRADLEKQLSRLNQEHDRLFNQIKLMKQKRSDMEIELMDMRQRRIDLEKSSQGNHSSFVDPSTYEMVHIPLVLKSEILSTVFKCTSPDISSFLSNHNISLETRQSNGQDFNTIEKFCALTAGSLAYLSQPESQRILNLSETARNKVKDSLIDQKALKFNLERSISKIERDLKHLLTVLHTTLKQYENGDFSRINIEQILHPSNESFKVVGLTIEQGSESEYATDYLTFVVNSETVTKLRQFHDYVTSLEGTTSLEKQSAFDKESEPSCFAICLSAFCIVLKNITGVDKFVIDVMNQNRSFGVLGPLSDPVPLKFDMSDKEKTVNALLLKVWANVLTAREYGLAYPSVFLNECFNSETRVCFEYIDTKIVDAFDELGVTSDQLQSESSDYQRIWSINSAHHYDLKFIVLDSGTILKCRLEYNPRFGYEKACKWMDKIENTLGQIEYGGRRQTITGIISRLYNKAWNSSSGNLVGQTLPSSQSFHSMNFGSSLDIMKS